MSQNVRNAAQHPSTNSNTIANNQNNNSSILNFFSVTDDSQLVSSMDTINQMGGRRDSDINSLSYTHVPIMPDLYLPYGELEKCPEIQLLPKDETDADACKALIGKRKRGEPSAKKNVKNLPSKREQTTLCPFYLSPRSMAHRKHRLTGLHRILRARPICLGTYCKLLDLSI